MEAVAEGDAELRPAVGARARRSRSATARSTTSASIGSTADIKTTQYANAPPGFLYPGDAGFDERQRGHEEPLVQFSPRVGFAWDPAGDGRMSIRAGYSLAYDFVNAQFHLNTSVAPPFNAEARVDEPGRWLRRSLARHGQRELLPVHDRTELGVPAHRAVHLDPAGHQAAAATVVEPERAAADRQRPGRVGDLHRHATPIDCGTCARSTPASTSRDRARCRPPTGPQFFPVCSVNTNLDQRRLLTMADYPDGKYLGSTDEHTALGTQKYNGILLSVQRRLISGFSVAAQLHAVEVHGSSDAGRHHAQRQLRLRGSEQYRLRLRCVRLGSPSPLQPDRERRDAAVRQ